MALEKFACSVGAIDFEPLCVGMIGVDKPQVVKQRCDIEQLRIEFEILTNALHCAEHKNADGVVEQQPAFVLPHEFGGFACDLAVGNLDAGNNVNHRRTPVSVSAICASCIDQSFHES